MIRKAVRIFLQKRGYDIIKTGKPEKEYHGLSDTDGYTFHPTPIGNYYIPANTSNDVIARHMKQGILFEPDVIKLAKKYILPGSAVLDVGANFGQMSIEFSKTVGNEGMVYSFEAQKAVFDVLVKNVEANGLTNVECIYGAVYNKSNETMYFPEPDFVIYGSYGSYGLDSKGQSGIEVNSITIDSLKIEKPVSFMKVDVQGSDLFAMQGAKETIMKNRMPVLFEFEQQFQDSFNTNFGQYVDFVRSIDYRFAETVMDINFLILPNG
jgi:FkbM family methyltransferase